MFAFLYYCLVGNENTAVELTYEVANEFVAALYLLWLVLVNKKVGKLLVNELFEKVTDKFLSELRLQLVQKVVAFDQLFVVVKQWLLNVQLDLVVQDFWQTFTRSRVVKLNKPNVDLFQFGLHNVVGAVVFKQDTLNRTHRIREKGDTYEFNKHVKDILNCSPALDVSISYRGKSSHCPVKRCNIFSGSIWKLKAILYVIRNPAIVDILTD